VAVCWSVAGLCAGVLVPHVAGGIAATLALPLMVEPVVGAALPGSPVVDVLPFRSALSAYDLVGDPATVTASGSLPGALALLPFLVVAATTGVLCLRQFVRMDL
jgi:hypothetical protein